MSYSRRHMNPALVAALVGMAGVAAIASPPARQYEADPPRRDPVQPTPRYKRRSAKTLTDGDREKLDAAAEKRARKNSLRAALSKVQAS